MSVLNLIGGNPILALLASTIALSKENTKDTQPKTKVVAKSNTNPKPQKTNNSIDKNKSNKINADKSALSKNKKSNNVHNKFNTNRDKANKHKQKDCTKALNTCVNSSADLCLLGKNLILSGAVMEESLAAFLETESRKVAIATDKFRNNYSCRVTINDLVKFNKSLKGTICCLSSIEEEIMKKIKTGEKLLNEKDLCEKCLKQQQDFDLDFSNDLDFDIKYNRNKKNTQNSYSRKQKNNHDNNYTEKCIHELQNIDLCILGKKLIFSGAVMEENLAAFLEAESRKIDAVVDKFKKDQCSDVTTQDLLEINNSIKDSICCLAEIEEKIGAKIKLGEKLLHEKDTCKIHCHQKHDDDDDD